MNKLDLAHPAALKARTFSLYLLLGLFAFVALMPLLYMIATSLKSYGETITRVNPNPFNPEFWPREPQWVNYLEAWQEGEGLWHNFVNSVVISVISVAGIFATSIPAAYAFAKIPFRGASVAFALFLATLIIPETVLTLANFITVTNFGWNNTLLALTLPFFGSAFYIFFLRQFFKQLPDSLIESARLDGAGTWTILWRIAVPLAGAPLFTVGFLAFSGSWNSLQWPLLVTNTPKWRPIAVGLTKFLSEAGPQTHLRMAASSITLIPVVAIYIIAQKQITEGVTRSGIKG